MELLKGITILVVEDEEDLRQIIIESLVYRGATVVGAENGKVAFEILQEKKIDVVLSDIRMPGGNGIELLKNIQESLSLKPKLFLYTGHSDLSEAEAKGLGVIRIFQKPFDMKEFAQVIWESFHNKLDLTLGVVF